MINKQNETAIKYILYARKSSEAEDRQAASIQSQVDEMNKIISREGLNVVDVMTEAQTSKQPGRPVFNSMLERINKGEANAILTWKIDRLSRNPIDSASISWMLQKKTIKQIKTYDKTYLPSDNILMLMVEQGMANQFVIDLSKNVKRGLHNKVTNGWLPGIAPIGYENVSDRVKGFKTVTTDLKRFTIVRQLWDYMLTGNYTVPQVWKKSIELELKTIQRRNEGGKYISLSAMYRIFSNPFYYGWFEFPDKDTGEKVWHKGKHVPMITEEEFDHVQSLMGKKTSQRPKEHMFAFTGLMKCGTCNCSITAENKIKKQKNGNVHRYTYYHCTHKKTAVDCKEKGVEVKSVHEQILNLISKIKITEKFKDWAIKHLHELRINEAKSSTIAQQKINDERDELKIQLRSMTLNFTSEGNKSRQLMSDKEFIELKTEILKRIEEIEIKQLRQNQDDAHWAELSKKTFDFACYADIWFENGDIETKRAILGALGSNLQLKDGIISISLHPFLKIIEESNINDESQKTEVRTCENSQDKRKNKAFNLVLSEKHPVRVWNATFKDFRELKGAFSGVWVLAIYCGISRVNETNKTDFTGFLRVSHF